MNTPLPLILLAIAAVLTSSCEKRKPSVKRNPTTTEETKPEPDTLAKIGREAADLVGLWVLNLSEVDTEESADRAAQYFEIMEDQFDVLVERTQALPKLSAAEFKRIDQQVDQAISQNASDLESQRRRIFLLPDQIKSKVLPNHDRLLKKFREMSRAIAQYGIDQTTN